LTIHAKGVSEFFLRIIVTLLQLRHSVPATYTVSTDTLNWGAARAACKKQSADLVSIETEQENKCVKDKIQLAGLTFVQKLYIAPENSLEWLFFRQDCLHCPNSIEQDGTEGLLAVVEWRENHLQRMERWRTSSTGHRELRRFSVIQKFIVIGGHRCILSTFCF
jgi:hypothetical protein